MKKILAIILTVIMAVSCFSIHAFADEEAAYPMVSEEAVLLANPDFIFYSGDGMGGGKPSDIFKPKGGIYYMGDDDSFVRSTPRCADAVEKLAAILWNK